MDMKRKLLFVLGIFFFCTQITLATANLSFSNSKHSLNTNESSYVIQYQNQVNQLLKEINSNYLLNNLSILTSKYPNRSSLTKQGEEAVRWMENEVSKMIVNSKRQDVTIFKVETGEVLNWYDQLVESKQSSLVIKIGNSTQAGIVIGAHIDSVEPIPSEICEKIDYCRAHMEEMIADRPGADDDGSGSVTVLELARILLKSDMNFKRPIYLIWYAAEEDGLKGSQRVVASFQKQNIPVKAVMQLDMTGYVFQNDPTMWLVNNNVDMNLTKYLAELIREYVKQPVKFTTSNGLASDHASWNKQGIPAAFPFESEMSLGRFNLAIHTKHDTIDKLSIAHMVDYEKLAIAFAVELAEPI